MVGRKIKVNPNLFFKEREKEEIVEKIREVELKTSGEIRVHIDRASAKDALKHAVRIFDKIGMAETKERNGVLIYINSLKRSFAVIGDNGIHEKVADRFWESVAERISKRFKDGAYLLGVLDAIKSIGDELQGRFPRKRDDANELPDSVSYGD